MKKPIDKSVLNTDNPVLTDIELNALREEFGTSRTPYDIHDLILADIAPEILQALRQADSITIIAKKGEQELHLPLHVTDDGYHSSLKGPRVDTNSFLNQHKLHKFQ